MCRPLFGVCDGKSERHGPSCTTPLKDSELALRLAYPRGGPIPSAHNVPFGREATIGIERQRLFDMPWCDNLKRTLRGPLSRF
jgi:hypothetical protein